MNIATNGKHCTRIIKGNTVECYRAAAAEYQTKRGDIVVRLCRLHDTRVAREAAEILKLTRIEL